MSEDADLSTLLRTMPRAAASPEPGKDLWPCVAARLNGSQSMSGRDVALAVMLALVLGLVPRWLWLMAYHL